MPTLSARRVLLVALSICGSLLPRPVAALPGDGTASAKISSAVRRAAASLASGGGAAAPSREVAVDPQGRLQVRLQLGRLDAAVLARLESAGMEIEIHNVALLAARGWIDPRRLGELAALEEVLHVTTPDYRRANAGSVEGEHDAALRCDATRSAFAVDGTGVRVGVISDGIDHADSAEASGDAPAIVLPADARCHRGSGDEGSAMIEIVHDCAPGAEIAFCGPLDDLEMVDCLGCLSDAFGADVIVDDLGFLRQPFFEDGPIAVAVEELTPKVAYFTAAGNQARTHYQGVYVHCPDASTRHDFGEGDCTLDFFFSQTVGIVLQWDEPFGAASSDYDLCVVGEGCSSDPQDGDDDPIESLAVGCDQPGPCARRIEINRFSGTDRVIEIYLFPFASSPVAMEHAVPEDSIFGHPCAEGALAIGAISVADDDNDAIESFSSRGPCTMGSPAVDSRPKPDLAGLDGISNSGAGGFPSPFFGTSASAPGVAAVGALLLDFDPGLPPALLGEVLRANAVDLGSPGFDSTFGAGRVDSFAAVSAITPRPTPTATRTATATPTRTPSPTRTNTPMPGPCFGDCDSNGAIAIDELVTAVRIALGMTAMDACTALDSNRDGIVAIDEIVHAVGAALFRCVAGALPQNSGRGNFLPSPGWERAGVRGNKMSLRLFNPPHPDPLPSGRGEPSRDSGSKVGSFEAKLRRGVIPEPRQLREGSRRARPSPPPAARRP